MLPQIDIFGFEVAMYGLMIVFGVAAGILVAVIRTKNTEHKREDLVFASLYAAIGTVVGAKLLYLLTILPFIIENLNAIFSSKELLNQILTGGFVFYGGVIGGAFAIFLYCRIYKLGFLSVIDALIPSVPLVHAFGRLGCFFAGCCYGIEFPEPIGMYFNRSPFAPHNVTLFPVQLAESACNLVLFLLLLLIARRVRERGVVLGSYLIIYPIARFILEYFRWDEYRGFIFGLSTSQWISIVLFIAGIFLTVTAKRKRKLSI